MELPDHVRDLVAGIVLEHSASVEQAIQAATSAVRALPDFDDLCDVLINGAIQSAVYQARHALTTRARRDAGTWHTTPAVVVGNSPAVQDASLSFFRTFCIGGTCIGELTLPEIERLKADEEAQADGHEINAQLLGWLQPRVRGEQRVREAVREAALVRAYNRIRAAVLRERTGDAA